MMQSERVKNNGIIAQQQLSGRVQAVQFKDNRTENTVQLKVQQLANSPVQLRENKTGMPDQLKSGIENLSGLDMSDVKVHYNSSQPAQLQAHAYAQGNQIHLAPGQERHLPHEAWHVVQQKQGRVSPTRQLKGQVNINDDHGLEHEADVMGAKAWNMNSVKSRSVSQVSTLPLHIDLHRMTSNLYHPETSVPIQREATKEHAIFIKDAASELASGQMAKPVFLSKLKLNLEFIAEKEMRSIGQTAKDCPFIDYWITFFSKKTASQIEQAVFAYAPNAHQAKNAQELIDLVSIRVKRDLQQQIAKSPLKPVDPKKPEELQDQQGSVEHLSPKRILTAPGQVVQRGSCCSSEAEPPRKQQHHVGDLHYGISDQRYAGHGAMPEPVHPKAAQDAENPVSVDELNAQSGITATFDRADGDLMRGYFDVIALLNAHAHVGAAGTKPQRWLDFLKANLPYLSIQKHIDQIHGGAAVPATKDRLTKNGSAPTGLQTQAGKRNAIIASYALHQFDPAHVGYENLVGDWVWDVFFRRTSKLGIKFTVQENKVIHMNMYVPASARRGTPASTVNVDAEASATAVAAHGRQPITQSELRYIHRTYGINHPNIDMYTYDTTTGGPFVRGANHGNMPAYVAARTAAGKPFPKP